MFFNHASQSIKHALAVFPAHVYQEKLTQPRRRKGKNGKYPTIRGRGVFYMPRSHNQRCIVKIAYTKNTKTRSWAAHGQYLQREHAQNMEGTGSGFNHLSYDINMKELLRTWQKAEDPHLFKVIVSPENGQQMNLKQHAKDLMLQMERDLKTKLEWAAIDHHNTDNPHLHILIRGIDEHGNTLLMDARYLSQGIRHRSQEIATLELGLCLAHDRLRKREQILEKQYVTEIDRSLRHKAQNSMISYHNPVSDNVLAREYRLLEIKRLKFLESLGLAQKIAPKAWRLSDNLETSLKELQISHDIIKSRARHQIPSFNHEKLSPTLIKDGKSLTGKVIGMGLDDELQDRRYLLLDGIDGKVHYIQATNSIVKARDNHEFENGHVITLEKHKFTNEFDKTIEYIKVHNHIDLENLASLPLSRINNDIISFVMEHGIAPKPSVHEQSFANEYALIMRKRFDELVNENVITLDINGLYHLHKNWQLQFEKIINRRYQNLTLTNNTKHALSNERLLKKSKINLPDRIIEHEQQQLSLEQKRIRKQAKSRELER